MKDNCCGYDICSPVTGFCGGGGYCGFYQPCTNIQEVVDQNQSVADEYVAGFDQPDLAQSFHQDRFNITGAEIFLYTIGTEDRVRITVYDALPNAGGIPLTTGGTIARANDWARVKFPPVSISSDKTYYLVFESDNTGGLGIKGSLDNPYPFGMVFANSGFGSFPNYDYTFRTFAELPIFGDGFELGGTGGWSDAPTCSIWFDDAWSVLGAGGNPDTFYSPFGVNFDIGPGYGLNGGESDGDPGNWNIEGTYGSAFWGIWSGVQGVTFNSPVTDVSLDMLRGHDDYTITVEAFLGGGMVGAQTVNLVGQYTSEPITFAGPLDQIVLYDTGVSGAGIDNLVYKGLPNCPPHPSTVDLSLDVALQAEPGSCLFDPGEVFETVAALLTGRGHTVTFVTGADLDTYLEIARFDVVVLGGPGSGCTSPDYPVFDSQVDTYVLNGGGLVGAGWLLYNTQLDGAPQIEADMPAVRANGFLGATTVTPVGGHPITNGLGSFAAEQYVPYGGGAKPGATVILQGGGQDLGEVWTLGSGRVVYLGPMYFEYMGSYANASLLNGSQPDATEIMLRAIEWAGGKR